MTAPGQQLRSPEEIYRNRAEAQEEQRRAFIRWNWRKDIAAIRANLARGMSKHRLVQIYGAEKVDAAMLAVAEQV